MPFSPILLRGHNPGPMTGDGNNTYLLVSGQGEAALIDAGIGVPRHLQDLGRALGEHRARLESVLVTHAHRDHASGVEAIASSHPAAVFLKRPWPAEDSKFHVPWRAVDEGDVVTAGGEPLLAVHTPGHAPDHLAFWHEPSRTLFTGDLVILGGSVMIHSSRGGNLAQYMASLDRLLALEPRVLLPAHGPRVENPRAVLIDHLEHRRMRERQVLAALGAGRETVQSIAESIYHGLDGALLSAAQENVRAHLEKLRSDGVVRNNEGRWML